ncbi:MAG: single-stranded DNA-binding protein [Candidatus Omnitrophota bacterium]
MASLNKVLLIGNLTKDPELRYTPSGVAVANLRLAVNRRYKDKAGEPKEETCFITVTAWDRQAEVCNQYLQKGRPVFVEGRLQSRQWEGADGQKKSTIDIRAERIQFLNARNHSTPAASGNGPGSRETAEPMPKNESVTWDEEENVVE